MEANLRKSFDGTAFQTGLQWLSAMISQSPVLAPFCPLELVASGGYVSVVYLHNRHATEDLDYFLNAGSFGDQYASVQGELKRLIKTVADRLMYDGKWANDEVRVFLSLLKDPAMLFNASKQQNVVLYQDDGLVIYAVKWEWVLARKLKRLQMPGPDERPVDWSDCIAITKLLYDANGGKLSPVVVQGFDNNQNESPVLPETLMDLRHRVLEVHRVDSFPVAFWSLSSPAASFDYLWNDGTPITRDQWPALRGRILVYIHQTCQWWYYDCNTRQWGEKASG